MNKSSSHAAHFQSYKALISWIDASAQRPLQRGACPAPALLNRAISIAAKR